MSLDRPRVGIFCRFAIIAIASMCLFAFGARSSIADSVITGLYNTGVNNAGVPLAGGSLDHHYSLTMVPAGETGLSGTPPTAPYATNISGGAFPLPYWTGNTPTSAWISPQPAYTTTVPTDAVGDYTYQTTFYTATPTSDSISGQFAVDNSLVSVELNTTPIMTAPGMDGSFTSFSITSGFVPGLNTLTFIVDNFAQDPPIPNNGNPSGIQIQFAGAAGTILMPVPLPATAGVGFSMLAGLGAVATFRKRFSRRPRIV